ncbi:MAG: glycosyltransferase family 4 protein [Anaerolineales bacterium]
MKILLLSRYGRLGSTSRVRFYQYIPYLEAHGLQITIRPLLADEYVRNLYANRPQNPLFLVCAYLTRLRALLRNRRFDLIWVEKEFLPWLPPWAARLRTPYIADYDDAIFHRYDRPKNPIVRLLLGKKIDSVMRRAARVVAGNDYIAARARRAGAKRIEYLPTVIDTDHYRVAPATKRPGFNIGWIGAPITAPYLKLIQPALEQVCKQGGARLTLVGAGAVEMEGVPLEIRLWTEETEVAEIQQFDVGIMPLPDEPFERGKCGYKLIQYMGCGLPVVATPLGVNRHIVEHGINGFHAATTEEWAAALATLRDDPELRRRMGMAGRAKIEAEYSLQVTAPKLLNLLQDLRS